MRPAIVTGPSNVFARLKASATFGWANIDPFERPDRYYRGLWAMMPWGMNAVGALAGAAGRHPEATAVADDSGELSYLELWRRSSGLAAGLRDIGISSGDRVGLMCRNHRGFVEALLAISKSGADVILLNPDFAAPQLTDVVAREGIKLVLHDDDCAPTVRGGHVQSRLDESDMDAMASTLRPVARPRSPGQLVVLTSGTTGTPKGAARRPGAGATAGAAGIVDRIPFRVRDTQVIASPLFHSWGLTMLLLGLARCSTIRVSRRFDPGTTLESVASSAADTLVVVPVLLQRMLSLGARAMLVSDTSSLRIIASSGAPLGAALTTDVLNRFGPILYNLYGSTEVAVATIATPRDLRRNPSAAGRSVMGTRVEILDPDGAPVPAGSLGRIFVGGPMRFDGYTAGDSKEQIRGLLASGDVGAVDADGLLTVEGREDDMIVSGGENVFPGEIEELLAGHPGIEEVAVVGTSDADFGQALAAFVVTKFGVRLSEDEVKQHVRENLARFKVPRRVTFVDALPRTSTGKVLRRELAA